MNNPSLMDFVRVHNIAAVRVALQKSFELENVDAQLKTPLMIAIENQDLEIATFLVQAGANINAQDFSKNTPFIVAAAEGHLELLQLMLRYSPDFQIFNRYGGNALTSACERGHVEIVRSMLASHFVFDIDHKDDFGWTPLMETIILGDGGERSVEICKLLLKAGANPRAVDRDGKSCYEHAVRRHLEDIALLLKR